MTLRRAIAEPIRTAGVAGTDARVAELADLVGLTPGLLNRRPHEVRTANCNASTSPAHSHRARVI